MDKYLIVGLGNIGDEYDKTRHNTGFMVLDAFAKASNIVFEDKRYGFVAETSIKGRKVFLLKPSTYMNLSGNAVRYWMNKENIDLERLLVIVDDLALPLGTLRLKPSGSNAGHNGLGHIQQVLGKYDDEELKTLEPKIGTACDIIKSFVLCGVDFTMNAFNKRK